MSKYEKNFIRNAEIKRELTKALEGIKGLSDSQEETVNRLAERISDINLVEDLRYLESVKLDILNDVNLMKQNIVSEKGRYFLQYAQRIEARINKADVGVVKEVKIAKPYPQIALERVEKKLEAGEYKIKSEKSLQKQIVDLAFRAGIIANKQFNIDDEIAELEIALLSGFRADIRLAIKGLTTAIEECRTNNKEERNKTLIGKYDGIKLIIADKKEVFLRNQELSRKIVDLNSNITELENEMLLLDEEDEQALGELEIRIRNVQISLPSLKSEEIKNNERVVAHNLIINYVDRLSRTKDQNVLSTLAILLNSKQIQNSLLSVEGLQKLIDTLNKLIIQDNKERVDIPAQELIVPINGPIGGGCSQVSPEMIESAKQRLQRLKQQQAKSVAQDIENDFKVNLIKPDNK